MNTDDKIRLLVDGSRGVYVWQHFMAAFDPAEWHIQDEDVATLKNGPDDEWYWEAATNAEMDATYTDEHGHVWQIYQYQGDLFAYRASLTSEEIREAFP